jgi:hypothetical protein
LWEHLHVGEPGLLKPVVETGIGTPTRPHESPRDLCFGFELGAQRDIHHPWDIHRPHHHGHPSAGLGDPDHLGQHTVRIALFQHRKRHRHVHMLVWEGEGFRIPFPKRDDVCKALLHSQSCGLAEKIPVDVDANDAVGLRRVPGEPASQHPGPTPHL